MSQSVGIKDVARVAGVSVGTVSNVINRPDTVAAETRARVLSAIDRLGYVRSESARQLRAGRSRIMGLLVLDMGNPFFVDVASAGVNSTPRTRCSAKSERYSDSSPALCALLQTITPSPASRAVRSAPRATSTKKGLPMSRTSRPMIRLRPARSWRADSLRT